MNPDRVLVEGSAEEFDASRRAVEAWQRQHPVSLPELLAWIDSLRALFGDRRSTGAPRSATTTGSDTTRCACRR